jgi:glucokinase
VVTPEGKIIDSRKVATPGQLPEFGEVLNQTVSTLIDSSGPVSAIGIACKGIICPETTEVEILPGAFRFLEGIRLTDLLSPQAGGKVPVFADNDARVALVGEHLWGAARGRSNAIMVTLGSGLGGAILADGQLVRGARGVAGHLGHITMDPDGPLCVCGNRGCLETYFSALSIEAEALAAMHRGCESEVLSPNASCASIFKAHENGDPVAGAIVSRAIRYLAAGLAGLCHALDPEVVIMGGEISRAGSVLFEPVQEEMWRRTRRLLGRKVPLVPPEVEDPSGILGAAALACTAHNTD